MWHKETRQGLVLFKEINTQNGKIIQVFVPLLAVGGMLVNIFVTDEEIFANPSIHFMFSPDFSAYGWFCDDFGSFQLSELLCSHTSHVVVVHTDFAGNVRQLSPEELD